MRFTILMNPTIWGIFNLGCVINIAGIANLTNIEFALYLCRTGLCIVHHISRSSTSWTLQNRFYINFASFLYILFTSNILFTSTKKTSQCFPTLHDIESTSCPFYLVYIVDNDDKAMQLVKIKLILSCILILLFTSQIWSTLSDIASTSYPFHLFRIVDIAKLASIESMLSLIVSLLFYFHGQRSNVWRH